MARMDELAYIIRSKNAGPFWFTLDLLFQSEENYLRVKNSGVITKDLMAKLYNRPADIFDIYFFDNAWGIKISYPDCYGAQQHAPLLGIEIP